MTFPDAVSRSSFRPGKTITVEVYSFVGQYTARWDIVFAGTVCSIVPALIFVLLQKYFVKGISGAAKGKGGLNLRREQKDSAASCFLGGRN